MARTILPFSAPENAFDSAPPAFDLQPQLRGDYPDGVNQAEFDRAWNELGDVEDEPKCPDCGYLLCPTCGSCECICEVDPFSWEDQP